MATDEDRIRTIENEIASYLLQRPNAADTIDGIRQWWLPRIRLDVAAAEIRQALDHLVQRGIVIANALPDGNTVYRSASK